MTQLLRKFFEHLPAVPRSFLHRGQLLIPLSFPPQHRNNRNLPTPPRPRRRLHNRRLLPSRRHGGVGAAAFDEPSPRHLRRTREIRSRSLVCICAAAARIFLVPCTLAELELLHSKLVSSRKQKCETLTIPIHLDKLLLFLAPDFGETESLTRRAHPRILDNREDYLRLHKHLFTFSAGPRSCLGRELAMASRSSLSAQLPPSPPPAKKKKTSRIHELSHHLTH